MDIGAKLRKIYAITQELEDAFPGRHFTPDGHLIGSIGEVLVAETYGLKLLPSGTPIHDAETADGRLVQIKATQIKRITLNGCPDFLIVIQIDRNGDWVEIYNGPGKPVWDSKPQKDGPRTVGFTALRRLMEQTVGSLKIAQVH